jgi:chromosome transmission fidelity protein 4
MQSLKNPVTIARLLYEEKIIAKDVLIKVESVKQPQKEKVSILLSSVRHAVSNKHHNLLLFGKCLEKVAENFLLGRAIIRDYKDLFEEAVTCHEDNISFETTNVKATTVPTATMAQTATTGVEKKINVPVSVQPTFSTMRAMFGRMFFNVRKAIAVHDIPIEDIKEFVICSYPYLKPSISHCETILDILMIVQEKCSLINVSLLDAIVHQFEIKEAKKFVAEYKNEIETFCGNVSVRLSLKEHFILNDNYSNLLCCEIAVFVLDWDADDCDMYTINDVKCILAHAFERLEIDVQIVVINECNSVAVICSFPVEITALLIAEAIKHFKILQKKGLVKLTIGCCTILDTRNEEEESDIRYQIPIITEVTTEEPSQKDDASDDIDLQSESAADKSELLGSDKDDTLCQQPDEEEQTFGHSLSTASSDHLLIIRDLTQKNEHLQAQLKSQEDYIQSLSESELSKVLEQTQKINKKIQMEKEQILKDKTKEIEELQEKVSSQSVTLLDKEKTIKNLESQYKENKLILEKFLSKVYSPSETTSVPEQSDPEKKVEWNKSGRGQVVLTSPSPSDCVGVINDLLNESVQCETIELQSSSPEAALALLSPLYQISSAKILRIKDTPLTNEMIYCLNEVIKSDQLEEIHFINASLGASGEMHSLADAIASNKSLRWLEVWDDRTLTDDDAENISKMLADNKTLETFQFGDCNLNNNHLQHLIKNLADNTTLKVLDISMNPITSTGYVCDIIKLSSLVELYLHNVSLPADDSTVQLMDALSTNETIKILSIDKRHEQFCQKHKKFEDLEERVRFR